MRSLGRVASFHLESRLLPSPPGDTDRRSHEIVGRPKIHLFRRADHWQPTRLARDEGLRRAHIARARTTRAVAYPPPNSGQET